MNDSAPAKRSAEDILAIIPPVVLYHIIIDDREWERFDQVFILDAVVAPCDHSAKRTRGLA